MRATHASPDDIDLLTVWGSLKRSLPRILLSSLLAGGLTFGALSLTAPRYASEAQIEISAKSSIDPGRDPRRDGGPDSLNVRMDKEAINTHVRALLSPDLAQKIITELKLDQKPEFNAAKGSPDMLTKLLRMAGVGAPNMKVSDLDRTLETFFKQLEVFSPKESRSIAVRFTSIDPELAKTIANRIAETYRDKLASAVVVESDDTYKDLEPKIVALKQETAAADGEVDRFRASIDNFKLANSTSTTNEQQMAELTAEVSKAKAVRSEAEARAKSAREMMKAGSADALPDVQKSPLMQGLVQQRVRLEREIAEVSAALLPGHPRMRQLSSELAGLKKQIAAEVAKVVDSLEREGKIAALTEEAKTKSLTEMKSRVVTAAPDEAKLRNLEATAKSKRDELAVLQAKFESAKVISQSQAVPVAAKVVSQARASSVVVYPKKVPFSALAALAIFFLGTALSITRALIRGARQNVPSPQPVAPPPGRPMRTEPTLVSVQPVAATAAAAPLAPGKDRVARITSIKFVADQLQSHAPGSGGCRTLIVGENNQIDASQEAIELVKELSERGVAAILVDWSPDGSGLATKLGLSRTPGISELLTGAAKFEDVVQRLQDGEAHVIASGAAQPYSAEGPDPDQLNLVLDALDEAYSHIVVVGPHDACRMLFEAIEGRFDAGITVSDGKRRVTVIQDPPGTFLGYEVADIELIRYDRKDSGALAGQRIVRKGITGGEAHPA